MKISAVPPVVSAMTMATQQSTDREMPVPGNVPTKLELTNPDISETKDAEANQPLSPQFAELAKRRRALQLKERALLEKEKALAAQGTGNPGIDMARLKSQPLNVLQEAGIMGDDFYNQLTEHLLANQSEAQTRALEAKVKALEESIDKKFVEKDTQARQQALGEIKRTVEQLVTQTDKFKLVAAQRKIPDVINLIERTYDNEGWLMTEEQALEEVEGYLKQDYERLKSLYEVAQPIPEPQAYPKQQMGMRTLKNTDTAPIALSRRARALAAFNNYNK